MDRRARTRDTPLATAAREAFAAAQAAEEAAKVAERDSRRAAATALIEAVIAPVSWRDSGLDWVADDPLVASDGVVSLAVVDGAVVAVRLVDGGWTRRTPVASLADVGRSL